MTEMTDYSNNDKLRELAEKNSIVYRDIVYILRDLDVTLRQVEAWLRSVGTSRRRTPDKYLRFFNLGIKDFLRERKEVDKSILRLRRIMEKYSLTMADVAAITGYSTKEVEGWLKSRSVVGRKALLNIDFSHLETGGKKIKKK